MFWWGEAKAGVAFMLPRGIRCDRLAARAARHCCTVASEGTRPQGRGVPKYEKKCTFANHAVKCHINVISIRKKCVYTQKMQIEFAYIKKKLYLCTRKKCVYTQKMQIA